MNAGDGSVDPSRKAYRYINPDNCDDATLRAEMEPIIQRSVNLRINEFEQDIAERARFELEQGLLDTTEAARNAAQKIIDQGI